MTFTYVFNFGKDVIIMWICFTPTICTKGSVRTVYPFLGSSGFAQIFSLICSGFYPAIVIISVHYLQIFCGLYIYIYKNHIYHIQVHIQTKTASKSLSCISKVFNISVELFLCDFCHTLQNIILITDFLLSFWSFLTIATLPPGVTKFFDQLDNLDT